MINQNSKLFEEYLINMYMKNPNPELAEILIKEFSSHFVRGTQPSVQLNRWIKEKSAKAANNPIETDFIFGLRGPGQRPVKETTFVCMNAWCWDLIFKGISTSNAFEEVANIFSLSSDSVRIGFERKNHDFGERELCRFGLDLYLAIHQKKVSEKQRDIVLMILDEEIDIQMTKDLNHHRAKYRNMFHCKVKDIMI